MEIDFPFYFTVVPSTTLDNILSQLHFHMANQTLENLFAENFFTTTHLTKMVSHLQLALADNQTDPK